MDSPSRSRGAARAFLRLLLAAGLATGALTALQQGDRPGPATAAAAGKRFAVRGDGAGDERLVRYGPQAAAVLCRAVMGDALVFRDDNHFTATYARTLSGWLDRELPRIG